MAAGQLYHYQAEGRFEPDRGYRFDRRARLIDPYAKALAGKFLPATTASFGRPSAWSWTTNSTGKTTATCGVRSPTP